MFNHVMVGSDDLELSRIFYDAVLGALGTRPGFLDDQGRLIYLRAGGVFMISRPIDGRRAIAANGGTIGFAAEDADAVVRWHDAGLKAGGRAIEDAPGMRHGQFGDFFCAYLRDPDGNKLCAVYRSA